MANEKIKLNDKVKTKKSKKGINIDKYETDEAREVKKFIIILFSIIILVLAVYGITKIINKDKKTFEETSVTKGEIDYDKVSVGTMLNKLDKEYYVIVYDGEASEAVYYSALVTSYMNKKNSLPVYFCDLGNSLNKKYYVGDSKESNKNAQSVDEFAFKDLTLLKIKNNKIEKYIETLDTIKAELSV